MGAIALLLVGAGVFLFIMGLMMVKYSQFVLKRMVDKKHLESEFIIQSGGVPPSWSRRRLGKGRALARLRTLIKYFRVTPLISDEDARAHVVATLTDTLEAWKKKSWNEIIELNSKA